MGSFFYFFLLVLSCLQRHVHEPSCTGSAPGSMHLLLFTCQTRLCSWYISIHFSGIVIERHLEVRAVLRHPWALSEPYVASSQCPNASFSLTNIKNKTSWPIAGLWLWLQLVVLPIDPPRITIFKEEHSGAHIEVWWTACGLQVRHQCFKGVVCITL